MASYLPVLLVSVNANITPDDTVLVNAPRGQVDYLSHDWQEEDVWRSWRNMTRQKNEIQNGLRLENASWRTWWKQRNKLKTVSPETLNWLKDSDVTWLYGPLHTAIDWSAPPKPAPVPDEVERINLPGHLDFHKTPCRPQPPRTKPILKHRSITELLSLKFPVFGPPESDIDDDDAVPSSTRSPKRPCLSHIKSDTHIIRWGPSRAFRKDSPPRVPPSTHKSAVGAPGGVRVSLSQDSASSASASGSTERPPKKKHISFNTFVEQCIAIDKHPRSIPRRSGFGLGDHFGHDGQREDGDDLRWVDDDGCVANLSHKSWSLTFNTSYEEDREDNLFDEDNPLWLAAHGDARPRRRHLNGSAIHSDSDSDDGMIEIRPSSYRHPKLGTPCTKKKAPPRSKSASSSSSATTSTTASSTSSSTGFRQRRKSASAASDNISPSNFLSVPSQTSAYRPRLSHADLSYRDRVTIAPIAPTFLKTTGAWDEGFGDEDGVSDDDPWDYGVPEHRAGSRSGRCDRTNKKCDEEQNSDSTPVELVYVPPFGGVYDYGAQAYWRNRRAQAQGMEDEEDEMTEDVERFESQFPPLEGPVKINPQKEDSLPSTPSIPQESVPPFTRSPIPAVTVDSSSDSELISGGPSRNDCNSGSSTFAINAPLSVPPRRVQSREEGRGRSRGRSLSVSPIGGSSSGSKAPTPSSPGASGDLLTSRGRSRSCQDLQSIYNVSVATTVIQSTERRGRSSSRRSSVGSNSASIPGINSSLSSQSHSSGGSVSSYNSSTSPISGSISPDGGDARVSCSIGSAYAGGRMGGRERESRFERSSSSSAVNSSRAMSGNERRGRDRGTRDLGSGSGSSASPVPGTHVLEENRGRSGRNIRDRGQRPSPQAVLNNEPTPGYQLSSCGTIIAPGAPDGNTQELSTLSVEDGPLANGVPKMDMDASICSVSSESSTATIVPTSNVVSPKLKIVGQVSALDNSPSLQSDMERQMQSDREALEEVDGWRKDMPTPSNSPTLSMTAPIVTSSSAPATMTIPLIQTLSIECAPKHVRTVSSLSAQSLNSSSSSRYKPRSPPIAPSPPHPALPSTSSSHAPGEVGATSILSTNDCIRSASMSLERASSGSRERRSPSDSPVDSTSGGNPTSYTGSGLRKEIGPGRELERELAEARRGRCGSVNGGIAEIWVNGHGDSVKGALTEPTLLVDGGHKERETIINKAMGMVSNAYLKLWPGQTLSPGAGAAQ